MLCTSPSWIIPTAFAEATGARKTEGTSSNDASQSSQKQPKQNMAREEGINNENWGFRFVVDPLRGVHYRVVREVELICRLGMGSRGGAGSTKPGSQVRTSFFSMR